MRPSDALKQISKLLLLGCVLFVPAVAHAQQLYADFDGDGVADVAHLKHPGSKIVDVWLSRTQTTRQIRTKHPIQRIIASDLNGDGRMEIVSADERATVRVWQLHDGKLEHMPRRPHTRDRSAPTPRNGLDDDDDAGAYADDPSTTPDAIETSSPLISDPTRPIAHLSASASSPAQPLQSGLAVRGPPSHTSR